LKIINIHSIYCRYKNKFTPSKNEEKLEKTQVKQVRIDQDVQKYDEIIGEQKVKMMLAWSGF
jgi:hypothetical protein